MRLCILCMIMQGLVVGEGGDISGANGQDLVGGLRDSVPRARISGNYTHVQYQGKGSWAIIWSHPAHRGS
jgi:hypothetical protein